MLEAKLVIVGGKTNRAHIKLKLPAVVGRGSDADITISHQTVSRHHCRLEEVDGALVLRDNGSTNGTFVGKKRIKEVVVKPGDVFSVGPLTFRAEYEHSGGFPMIGDPTIVGGKGETIEFTPGSIPGADIDEAPAPTSAPAANLAELNFDEPAATAPVKTTAPSKTVPPVKAAAPATASPPADEASDEFDLGLPEPATSSAAPADNFMADLFGDAPAPPAAKAPAPPPEPAEPEPVEEPAAIAESPAAEEQGSDEFDLTLPGMEAASAEPADDFMADLFGDAPAPPAAKAPAPPPEPAEPEPVEEPAAIAESPAAEEQGSDEFDLTLPGMEAASAEPADDFMADLFGDAPAPPVAKAAPSPAAPVEEAVAEEEPVAAEMQADEPLEMMLPGEEPSSEAPEDDFMADLFDEAPSPPAAQAVSTAEDEVEIDLHPGGETIDEVDFDLETGADDSGGNESEDDTTEMFMSAPAPAEAPSGKPAGEPDVLDLGPITADPIVEEPEVDEPMADVSAADDPIFGDPLADNGEANGELDFFAAEEAAPPPAQAAAEPADELIEEAPPSRKADKEKPAKKGWFGLGKGKDSKRSDKDKGKGKAEEAEEAPPAKPAKGKAAAKPEPREPELPLAVEPAGPAAASDEPDFDFLGSPASSGSPAKEEDDDLDNFFQDLGLN